MPRGGNQRAKSEVTKAYSLSLDKTSFAVIAAATTPMTYTHNGMGIIDSPFKFRFDRSIILYD